MPPRRTNFTTAYAEVQPRDAVPGTQLIANYLITCSGCHEHICDVPTLLRGVRYGRDSDRLQALLDLSAKPPYALHHAEVLEVLAEACGDPIPEIRESAIRLYSSVTDGTQAKVGSPAFAILAERERSRVAGERKARARGKAAVLGLCGAVWLVLFCGILFHLRKPVQGPEGTATG